jgi:hypothetical protein
MTKNDRQIGSAHYMDQNELYSRAEFNPGWLTLREIRANIEAAYQSGEEPPR